MGERPHPAFAQNNCPSQSRQASVPPRRDLIVVVAVPLGAGLLVAACGGGSAEVAPLNSPSSTTVGSPGGSSYRAALAYAVCVRSHGEPNFPDPSRNGSFYLSSNRNDPQLRAAELVCEKLLPGGRRLQTAGDFTPQQVVRLLRYAGCMRSHGIANFPDPTSRGHGSLNGIDPDSAQFASASRVCQPLLPNAGGSGPVTRGGAS